MNNEEEILRRLSLERTSKTPAEMAELLAELSGKLSQGMIVTYFKRAFPDIPLRTLLEASIWQRVGNGQGLSDSEFNEMLEPWIGPNAGRGQ